MKDQPKKKILGFDSWIGGAHNFGRLVKPFEEQGLDLLLLHLGSWGDDVGRPREETIGDLRVRDISFYGRARLAEILHAEKPDAVLFLSTDTFAHRAFIRYCREANVPTLHLYHGVLRVQPTHLTARWKANALAQARFVVGRMPKSLKHVLPCYARALWRTGAKLNEWLRFADDIVLTASGRYAVIGADDARTDRCCVLVPQDIVQAVQKYTFLPKQVSAVGLPDLGNFGLGPAEVGWHLVRGGEQGFSDIMYVDTGFIFAGGVFSSPQDFTRHLIMTKEALAAKGKHLVFKPHPDFLRGSLLDGIKEQGIEICTKQDFVPRLKKCCAAIVETSSASIIPAFMGLPLLLAKYGKLEGQLYGEILTSYPRSRVLENLSSFDQVLASEKEEFDIVRVRHWIHENTGPLPAEDMPYRVAEVMNTLIRERQSD